MQVREQLIELWIKQHKDEMKQMSPRVRSTKEYEFERWVSSERQEIEKEKQHYENTKKKTEDLISQIIKSASRIKKQISETV